VTGIGCDPTIDGAQLALLTIRSSPGLRGTPDGMAAKYRDTGARNLLEATRRIMGTYCPVSPLLPASSWRSSLSLQY
jgi:hypothetical protein